LIRIWPALPGEQQRAHQNDDRDRRIKLRPGLLQRSRELTADAVDRVQNIGAVRIP